MPAVGYTHADQSHFTSRHYWEVGATSASLRTGWLGRYLDHAGTRDNPLQGLSLDWELSPSLATATMPVATIDAPDSYDFWSKRVWGEVEGRMLAAIGMLDDPVAAQVDRLRTLVLPFHADNGGAAYTSPVPYPSSNDPFPKRLAGV